METQFIEGKEVIVGFSGELKGKVFRGGLSVIQQYIRLTEKAGKLLSVPLKDLIGSSEIGIASLRKEEYPTYTVKDEVIFKGKSFSKVEEELEKMTKWMSSADPIILSGDYLGGGATFRNEKKLASMLDVLNEMTEKHSLATSYFNPSCNEADLLEDIKEGKIDPEEGFVEVTTIRFCLPYKRGFLKEITVEWSVSLHCKVNRKGNN